jgi:hypothetical protein
MNNPSKLTALLAFERETRVIALDAIVPLKPLRPALKESRKYAQIVSSLESTGLVELPVVVPDNKTKGKYLLLDGLLRIEALKDHGATEVECIVSRDDEAYTYNKRVSRLSPVQEHRMVVRAVERGVPEEKIAAALNLDPGAIRRRFRLLDGICPEVAELLADKPCSMVVIDLLKKMKPIRQMQAVELIIGMKNYSSRFANTVLGATPKEDLVDASDSKVIPKISREQIARLEKELAVVQGQTKYLEETYGTDNLCLTVAKTYLAKLLGKAPIVRWLKENHGDYLAEFQSISELQSLASS